MTTENIEKIIARYREDVARWGDLLEITPDELDDAYQAQAELAALLSRLEKAEAERDAMWGALEGLLHDHPSGLHPGQKPASVLRAESTLTGQPSESVPVPEALDKAHADLQNRGFVSVPRERLGEIRETLLAARSVVRRVQCGHAPSSPYLVSTEKHTADDLDWLSNLLDRKGV